MSHSGVAASERALAPAAAPRSRAYLPEVDGLRACAALAVVAYHMNLLPIGWAGVWLFFVLSGFVITWMLLGGDWQLSGPAYLAFARRRAARIWPLYFLYAAIGLLVEFAISGGRDFSVTTLLGLVSFTYDFQAASETRFAVYHHLWTISVEQQFYLFYPFIFAAARRWRPLVPLALLVAAGLLARIVEFVLSQALGADAAQVGGIIFYWSFGQFDAFGVGALIAFYAPSLQRRGVYWAVLSLAAAIVIGLTAFDVVTNTAGRGLLYALGQPFSFPTKLPLNHAVPVTTYIVVVAAAAAMLATAIGPESLARRALRWAPLVRVGRISYGLYIWHMLIIVGVFAVFGSTFATAGLPLRLALFAPCLGLSLLVASVSYRHYESRFHKRIGTRAPAVAGNGRSDIRA